MVVWLFLHCLVVPMALAEPMLLDQSHLLQKSKRTIHRRQAQAGSTALRSVVDGIRFQMVIASLEHIQDKSSLGCQAPTSLLENLLETIL